MKIDKVTKMIEQPEVWLCHRNYKKICNLSPIDDLKIYTTANAVDEVSFTFHKNNNGVNFEYWEQIKSLKVVLVDGFGYFEIAVDKDVSDDTKKVITGVSIEAELGQITIDELEINGEIDRNNEDNWDSSGNYIQTVLCNFTDTKHSLLHRVLSKAPHWQLGSVAYNITENDTLVSTSSVHRTFNFSNTNIYDALQQIAQELDVVFRFNTVTRTINMYDLNTIGEDTTVFVSTQNLANDFTCSSNKDSIKNCFKIVGGDDLINNAVRAVNPNGSNYIYYFSPEQMEDMSDGLKTRLQKYTEKCEEYKDEYAEVCNLLYNAIDKVYELETGMCPSRTEPEDTEASIQIQKLTTSELGNIPVESLDNLNTTGAKKAVKTIAQLKVDYRYEVSIESSSYDDTTHIWTGKFKVENASNTTDSAVSSNDVTLTFIKDEKSSLQSKIDELVGKIDIDDDEDIETFKTKLKSYSQQYLKDYTAIYKECTVVLEKYSYKDKVPKEFYNFYHSYWEKWMACQAELDIRTSEVEAAKKKQAQYEDSVNAYHEILDFEFHMGDYYKEFCLYRRDDTYQNDNYISDGMNNSELLQNAQKLVEVATKELYKASLFQTVYTANLNNLFTNPIYKPFYDHFDLFNWIHADIDDKQVMLRLIGITYDFSSIDAIEVEFSEQVRNGNGISDIESILNQSKNMATSYSSTIKQAQNGQEACLEFDTIKQEGLNSALMNIKNSDNEEVVIDNCGINCRSKDQNDQYDQCQLRITGKNIVMTKDDYESCAMAIGQGLYNGQEVYGIWCDLLVGDCIVSETMLIANSSGTFLIDKDGIIVKNMKLDMSNADGTRRIVIDPELDSILSVYTNSKQVFYVDTNGNMCMLGNLYINNNGMYLKADMTSENIIEVGYGEITGTGNEGEAGSGTGGGVNTGNYVDTPWIRSSEGLNIIDLYDGGFSTTTNASNVKSITHNKIIEKNGEIYFIYGSTLRKYNKQSEKWDTISTSTYSYTLITFVKTNLDDNNLYICSDSGWSNYIILKFNLDTSVWSKLCVLHGSTEYPRYYLYDVYLDNKTLHLFGNSPDYSNKYYTLGTEDDRGALHWTGVEPNGTYIHRIIPYNGEVYAIYINGNNYSSSFGKITNLKTRTVKFIATLDSNCYDNNNNNQYCFTIMNDKLYIFRSFISNSNKFYIYDFKTEQLSENTDAPPLECYYSSSYDLHSGVCVFNDGENIHLYNGVLANRGASIPWNGDSWYAKFDTGYIAHYVYNKDNTTLVNRNFKELDSGKNFRISMQNEYVAIDNVIYEIECEYLYRYGESNKKYTTNIRKLDTSNLNNDWEIVYTFTSEVAYSPIQSNSKDKIYFVSTKSGSGYLTLLYYDILNKSVVVYYTGQSITDTTFDSSLSIKSYGTFGYLDEYKMLFYVNNTKFITIDIVANTQTQYYEHPSALSNQILVDNYFYFVANSSGVKLYKTSLEDGSTQVVTKLFDEYSNEMGFSIFYYNNKIQIFHSYNGVLSKDRYICNLFSDEITVTKLSDVFQDFGFYNVDRSCNYRTCFLPMIPTSTGVHIFVGYPAFFSWTFSNGGYKHYVYTEVSSDTPTDPDDPTKPPSVDNPTDKIFYITNKGDGYFYGTVYAKDGKFSGDIYARSLTLGENAVVKGEISSTTGKIAGWIISNNGLLSPDFGDYTTGTSGLGLYSDGNILNRGQWSGQDNPWYAYLYRGKWIFGLGNYYGAVADERYSDISANGIYMRSKDTITNSGNQYLFAVDTGEDTVNITNSSTSPGLTIYNNGNGASLQIKNATSGWVNRAFGGEIVIGTDENGDKKTANISIFGEKEYGRLVLRTDLGNDVDCDCGAVGTQNFRWNEGYFNQLYSTKDLNDSDAKIKDIHGTLDKEKSLEFINSLNPCEYNFKKSNHQRTHMGFIAQEVNQTVKEQELGDLAIYEAVRIDEEGKEYYYSEEYPDEELKWSLNYNEFIAPIVSSVQLLSEKITALENRVNTLEQENSELKKEIKELKGVE